MKMADLDQSEGNDDFNKTQFEQLTEKWPNIKEKAKPALSISPAFAPQKESVGKHRQYSYLQQQVAKSAKAERKLLVLPNDGQYSHSKVLKKKNLVNITKKQIRKLNLGGSNVTNSIDRTKKSVDSKMQPSITDYKGFGSQKDADASFNETFGGKRQTHGQNIFTNTFRIDNLKRAPFTPFTTD